MNTRDFFKDGDELVDITTLSGYPLGSDEDSAFHRAHGTQVRKDVLSGASGKGTVLDEVAVMDTEFYASGRTVITVASQADYDRLAEQDLPEGVEVVVIDPITRIYDPKQMSDMMGVNGVPISRSLATMAAMSLGIGAAAAVAAAQMVEAGKSMAEAARYLNGPDAPNTDYPFFDGYPIFEDSSFLKPLPHTFDYPDNANYGKWAGRAQQQTKRVGKDRARNKAARKARQNNRRK